MAEKEYIVTLKKGVDADKFNSEMTASSGTGNIPNRTVDVANARTKSIRNTHYGLEDSEALDLKNDPRVEDVEVPPDKIPVQTSRVRSPPKQRLPAHWSPSLSCP